MVYKIPPGGGGGKPYPASGLNTVKIQMSSNVRALQTQFP